MWPSEIQDIPLSAKLTNTTPEPSLAVTPAMRFIRLPEVMQLTSLCRSAILAIPGFPRPLKLGSTRAKAWVELEVVQWMEQQIQQREPSVPR